MNEIGGWDYFPYFPQVKISSFHDEIKSVFFLPGHPLSFHTMHVPTSGPQDSQQFIKKN